MAKPKTTSGKRSRKPLGKLSGKGSLNLQEMLGLPPDMQPQPGVSAFDIVEFTNLVAEQLERDRQSLKLYEPLPFQERFHECKTKECILAKGNRAGGSLCGFIEDARAVLGRDPHNKYPKFGTLVCLGWGEQHIGRVIHKYLFEPGAFRVIFDAKLGKYRVFKPWLQEDKEREELAEPAPPLIPAEFVPEDSWAWIDKRAKIFTRCEVVTDDTHWTIIACNSNGSADQLQGINVNLYHIDEDVATSGWYDEAIARTMATGGLIRWTAMPHSETDDITNMIQRAEEQAGSPNPDSTMIRASIDDNPHLPVEERERSKRLWMAQGEDVYRMRVFGIQTLDSVRMYPTFDKYTHNAVPYRLEREKDGSIKPGARTEADIEGDRGINAIQRILIKNGGKPPSDWCRYATVDPGHTVAAALFWAIPPESIGQGAVVYDELYLHQCDAKKFAREFARKAGQDTFQAFIIDAHGGALREIGSGIQPKEQYRRALEELHIQSVETGSGFLLGSDDVRGREGLVREWLQIDGTTGQCRLMVVVENCPNLCEEMLKFRKKRVQVSGRKVTIDEGERRSGTHAIEALEYGVAHGLPYVSPAPPRVKLSRIDLRMKRERERAAYRAARDAARKLSREKFVTLGPTGA